MKIAKDIDFSTLDEQVADWQSGIFTVVIYIHRV